ncbi:MAG: CDP-glucose 4,6-dehydratase [Candidatus Magasanikbacteria bacterium GW2011_GWA2_37_8]|uniref:CDP-glucose 4,6-dehydratase n=1 Tax=Candidatus Magasanikbacteria bacterium GW2011_GWA2_37_8 TaxID=1619036 RepID=A0A0G0KJC3_9BACT|nr:MAG: CDP-glucose 4,6-dehydratase [Candidatus Magasanikbacteria bacterium GW2011_GWA2_37_8]
MKNFYQNKKVLVTGHSGFKGSWLVKILNNWGAEVIGVSLPPDTTPNLFEVLNLANQIKENYFVDIRDFDKIKEIVQKTKPEIVFHLAAQPLVRDSYNDPLYTYSINVLGTANILQVVKEVGGIKSVVAITTDKVYENKEWAHPYKETDALGGYDPYSASKAAADIVTNSYLQSFFNPKDFNLKHNTLVAIARAGNVIGGGDWAKDRLVPDMVRSIFEHKESLVIRNPKSIRPWQHVLEPLRGYLMLAEKLYNGNSSISGAWNFGPQEDSFICVEELVKNGIKILGRGNYEIIEDDSKHEANLLKLDINKALDKLQWKPKLSFEGSLKETFDWYREFYINQEKIIDFTDEQIKLYFNE